MIYHLLAKSTATRPIIDDDDNNNNDPHGADYPRR
jgi:hypothetical protein